MEGCVSSEIGKGLISPMIRGGVQYDGLSFPFCDQYILCLINIVLSIGRRFFLVFPPIVMYLLLVASSSQLVFASDGAVGGTGITELFYKKGLVDLRVRDADLKDVLKQLSEVTGVKITAIDLDAGPGIKVSATIRQSPIDDAVRQILAKLPASGLMSLGKDKEESGSGSIEHIYVITRGGDTGKLFSPAGEISGQEEESIRFNNRRGILAAQNVIRKKRKEQKNDGIRYSSAELKQWITILYKDALMWRLLEQNISLGERELIIELLNDGPPNIIPDLIVGPSPHLSDNYIKILKILIEDDFNTIANSTSIDGIGRRLSGLINRRKEHSDVYFKTKLKKELLSEDNSLDQKIRISSAYLYPEDISMLRRVREYFNYYLDEKSVTEEDRNKIQEFLERLNNVN